MSVSSLARVLLVASAAVVCLANGAQAAQITARLTAIDYYAAYTGAADGSGLTYLGGAGNAATAEDYSATTPAGAYLYVVAWATTNNETNAFQGSVTVQGGGTTYTDATHWQAIQRPNPGQGWGNNGTPPGLILLASDIANASWQSSLVSLPPSTQFDPHGGGQAQWIWLNSFDAPAGPAPYTIFRTVLEESVTSEVPEPGALALTLAGLLGIGVARRRSPGNRSQCSASQEDR